MALGEGFGQSALRAFIWLLSYYPRLVRGRREPPDARAVRRIVVLQMSGVGDLLLITPALRALHRLYPEAIIDLITYRMTNAEFLFHFPYVRRGEEFPLFDLELKRAWRPSFWRNLNRVIRFVHQESCDLYVSFHNPWLLQWYLFELWLAVRSRARCTVGINPRHVMGRGAFDLALSEALAEDKHYRWLFLELVGLLGKFEADPATEFPLLPEEARYAQRVIETWRGEQRKVVCMHTGARYVSKLWPLDRFAELAERLQDLGCGIILIGMREEQDRAERICRALSPRATLNLAGKTTLGQMAALIDASDLFVGNDSGPLHIAIARRRPAIGLVAAYRKCYHGYEPQEAWILKNSRPFDPREPKNAVYPWDLTVHEVYTRAKAMIS